MRKIMFVLALTLAATTLPARARAQSWQREPGVAMGVDGGVAVVTTDSSKLLSTGVGVLARGGYEFRNGLAPELAVTVARWGAAASDTDASEWQLSVMPGLRWTILGGLIRPWIAAHLGYGRLGIKLQSAQMGTIDVGQDGFAVNSGAGLDVMFTPRFGVGAHLLYNKVVTASDASGRNQEGEEWVTLGAGLALSL